MRITYGITGTFPWTFTSRKMTILTFSHFFLLSRPTHSCTDIKFIDNATKSSGCRTCQCRRPFLCAECSVTHMQNKKNSHTSSLALSFCKLIALRVTSQLADRFVAGEYLKHVSLVKGAQSRNLARLLSPCTALPLDLNTPSIVFYIYFITIHI